MANPSDAPERDPKNGHDDADDSGDEDVFHDAHFPAEEEAVSRSAFVCLTLLANVMFAIATPERIPGNQI
jgi:hypothetical protein